MVLNIDELDVSMEIPEGQVVSIGRKGHGADIEIDNANISRQHAEIKLQDNQILIFDKKSTNGISVNGHKIPAETWRLIDKMDKVTLLGCVMQFNGAGYSAPQQKMPQPIFEPKPEPTPEPKKEERKAEKRGLNTIFIDLVQMRLPIRIGRLATNDIVLPDVDPDDRIVGRNHAEITFRDGRYWIEDLDSKNGTYVNDERIPARQPRPIDKKDIILIHLHYFNLEDGYRDLRDEVAIRAEGIGKTYPNGFVGLNPMTVEIPHKQIVALMGPSGCGKSTLLKALNGDNPATSGNVYIHGLSLRENYSLLKRKIGYVPQDDTIHSELTVEDTLFLAAKIRLPDDTEEEEIEHRISEVLNNLNFTQDVRKKKVGGLSGGQRKRICIAVELLSRPTILFLDEPTSPLDPETIEEFLNSLKKLANQGTTIVMVTHKPEDLNFVDKVIFMATKGYFVYYGDKKGLTEKFNVDHIIKVYTLCGSEDSLQQYYIKPSERIVHRPAGKNVSIDKQNSLLLQLYWLTARYLKIKLNDRQNLILLLAQPFIIAGLISVIFHTINISVMMLIAISAIWFGVSNSSKEIVGEFAVYKRERMFNLDINTYILSKWAVLSLIALVQVVIFIAIVKLRFGSDVFGGYFPNVGYMFYITSAATLFGLFLSAYFNTTEKVLTVVPIALMPQIMLTGVVEKITNVKVDILSYLTLGRWGTEGITRLQKGNEMSGALKELYYGDALKGKGEGIVTLFDGLWANIFIILILSAIMYVLTYYSLKKKDTI